MTNKYIKLCNSYFSNFANRKYSNHFVRFFSIYRYNLRNPNDIGNKDRNTKERRIVNREYIFY